ncbi:MAG: DUF2306 domain-containing protein [Acidobacteriota bacterium]
MATLVHTLERQPGARARDSRRRLRALVWAALAVLALQTSGQVLVFLGVGPSPPLLIVHAIASAIALGVGPFLFLGPPRGARGAAWHRALGRLVVVGMVVGAVTGFVLGLSAAGNFFGRLGNCLIAVGWLATAWLGVVAIRHGRVAEHRRWLIRAHAFSFGAVVLRVLQGAVSLTGLEATVPIPLLPWLAWPGCLLVTELFVIGPRGVFTRFLTGVFSMRSARSHGLSFVEVLGIVLILGLTGAIALPNLINTMDRRSQKKTTGFIRTVATAVESYSIDHDEYPLLVGQVPVERLVPFVEPTYIDELPLEDGWGRPLLYETPNGQTYVIRSLAKDGVPSGPTVGATTDFRHDIVFDTGSFTVVPEGPRG